MINKKLNDQVLSLAYSTCPNDTFLFYALAFNLIDLNNLSYSITLDDVETLNHKASKQIFDISKLSFAAIGHYQETYGLLRTGAALGRGCGPLLIAKPGYKTKNIDKVKIAVPGIQTTANLLLGLWLGKKADVVPMTFDQIMPAVISGQYDFGVIIHEGRFTYQVQGLECVIDLGKWWEDETSLPIPLGGIAIKRDLPYEIIKQVEKSIGESVIHAFNNKNAGREYINQHAQEMENSVIDQHIDLYVNDFTKSLGNEGEKAVEYLFEMARQKGVMANSKESLFAI